MVNAVNQLDAEDVLRPENSDSDPVEQVTQSEAPEANEQSEANENKLPEKVPYKVLAKKARQLQAEKDETERLRQEVQALKQEQELYKIVGKPVQETQEEAELIPPNPNNFIDDDEWIEANRKYNEENTKRLRREFEKTYQEQQAKLQESQQQAKLQKERQAELEGRYESYYDKADELGIDDFLEREEVVRKQWAPWFFDEVVRVVPNSHQLIVELSKDPQKALDLAVAYDNDKLKGGAELFNYANSINPINQKGDPLPEPDEPLKGGAGGVSLGSYEDELDKAREQFIAGQIDTNQLLAKKEALKAKYGAA